MERIVTPSRVMPPLTTDPPTAPCPPPTQEVEIGAQLPAHPNLVEFKGSCDSRMGLISVWERVQGSDLQSLFAEKSISTPHWHPKEKYVLSWGKQLFAALACLHGADMIHRDVKPANVLVTHDLRALKLIDYGLCRQAASFAPLPLPLACNAHGCLGLPLYALHL